MDPNDGAIANDLDPTVGYLYLQLTIAVIGGSLQAQQWPELRPAVVSVPPLARMPHRTREQAVAIEQQIQQSVAPADGMMPVGSHPGNGRHVERRRPPVALARSLALAALAGLGILVVLPAALAAQAAAGL
jgi:hypothetical protein